jgi:hypothetical protein
LANISSSKEEIAEYIFLDGSKLDLFYWMGQSKMPVTKGGKKKELWGPHN